MNVDRFGNTSSASIPIAIDEAISGTGQARDRRCSVPSAPGSPGARWSSASSACRTRTALPGQGSQHRGWGRTSPSAFPPRAKCSRRSTTPSASRSPASVRGPGRGADAHAQRAARDAAHHGAVWAVVRNSLGDGRRAARALARRVHGVPRRRRYPSPRRCARPPARGADARGGQARPGAMAAMLGLATDRGDLCRRRRTRPASSCRPTTTARGRS